MKYSISGKKVQITFYSDSKDRDKFQQLYPHLLTLFLFRAIKRAINDKEFFDSVFFWREK